MKNPKEEIKRIEEFIEDYRQRIVKIKAEIRNGGFDDETIFAMEENIKGKIEFIETLKEKIREIQRTGKVPDDAAIR